MNNKGQSPEFCRTIGKMGGRPRGRKSKAQMKKEAVAEEYRQLVLADAVRLFYSQSTLAHGQTFLFRIDKIPKGKNRFENSEPKLVTDPHEMQAYLSGVASGANGDVEDEHDPSAAYYFLTAREPNQTAIADMLDRAFGRARQVVGLEGSTPGSAIAVEITDEQYARLIREEFNRIGAGVAAADGAAEAQPHSEEKSA